MTYNIWIADAHIQIWQRRSLGDVFRYLNVVVALIERGWLIVNVFYRYRRPGGARRQWVVAFLSID